jgi:hypothetical protein
MIQSIKGNTMNPIRFLLILFLTLNVTQVNAMGFLDFMRIYIFSEVDGVVLLEGKPVKGATVVRTADYKDKLYTDTVITDEQGRFHFDDIYIYSMRLSNTSIRQKIVIQYDGSEYLAWELLKRHENHYGELTDPEKPDAPVKKLNLRCELTGDQSNEQVIEFILGKRTIYGLSHWD